MARESEDVCRACGHRLHALSAFVLEGLGVAGKIPPRCIEGLCITCLEEIPVPQDANGYPTRCVNDDDVSVFLADRLRILAQRVDAGQSIDRCELIAGHWATTQPDIRCRRFASREYQGRRICGTCDVAIKRGRQAVFSKEQAMARTFTIFALTPADLVRQALRYSREWNAKLRSMR